MSKAYISLDFQNKIYEIKAYKLIKKILKLNQKFLELGCADGSFASFISKKTKTEGWGIDISSAGIRMAKKLGINAQIHNLSKPLPFKKEKFDLVVALEVIEHLLDTEFLLKEINKVLKRNGYVIISTPNLASLNNRVMLAFGKYPRFLNYTWKDYGYHAHLYTLQTLKEHMKENGFIIIETTSPNFFNPFITKPWCPSIIRTLSMLFGDLFPSLGSHIVILARKSNISN